jgi:ATP-dependent DNA helicase RecQ
VEDNTGTPQPRNYTRGQVYGALKKYWGYDLLRSGQDDAIRSILKGEDSLVVMPTGGGKSLCFQLPAVVMGGLTIVISPLLALMKDQVDGLRENGYPAAALNSTVSESEYGRIMGDISGGRICLLYVSAKRAVMPGFTGFLQRLEPRAVIIDEAHCISQWGHDFVPEYRQLATLRRALPQTSFHGFTATATPKVQRDICDQLCLKSPKVMVGSFDRPNLRYRVLPRITLPDPSELEESGGYDRRRPVSYLRARESRANRSESLPFTKQIAEIVRDVSEGATLIYCIRRKDTESLAQSLATLGIPARAYHAGLGEDERHHVQEEFINERLNVVVATVAFGMGIDRPDVRCVIHANCPKTIEAFQQETGRAGRDGLPSECVLLFDSADQESWTYLINQSASEIKDPARRAITVNNSLDLLRRMIQFAVGSGTCRHKALSEYFGQSYDRSLCGACDVCAKSARRTPHGALARLMLSPLLRTPALSVPVLIDLLKGQMSEPVLRAAFYRDSSFGTLASFSASQISSMIGDLGGGGLLTIDSSGQLNITEYGREFVASDGPMNLPSLAATTVRASPPKGAVPQRAAEQAKLSESAKGLRATLRAVRARLARRRGVAPFVLFDDNTLHALVKAAPTTQTQLAEVPGLSATKRAEIGDDLLAAIEHYNSTGRAIEE